jgi:putative tryptophan/tyrosine transport system substrate-binding protein
MIRSGADQMAIGRRQFISAVGGATVTWPLMARAQQTERMRRIGVLMGFAETDAIWSAPLAHFRLALQRLGWTEGRNIGIDVRWTGANPDRTRTQAADIVAQPVEVIFVCPHTAAAAVFQQTKTIPIVAAISGDPVSAGFVKSYAKPGGNVTVFTLFEVTINTKYLQLLKDIAPQVNRVMVMQGEGSTWRGDFREIEAGARPLGVQPTQSIVRDAADIERAITLYALEPNGGIILPPDATTIQHHELIEAKAIEHRLPTVFSNRGTNADNGLIYYSADFADVFARSASYVDRILRGAKPADLPVQAPTKYQLVINLKTAKALGLAVPPSLLTTADEVIE